MTSICSWSTWTAWCVPMQSSNDGQRHHPGRFKVYAFPYSVILARETRWGAPVQVCTGDGLFVHVKK
jgi:hypothetical protein